MSFLFYRPHFARSVMPTRWANIPQYDIFFNKNIVPTALPLVQLK